MWGDGGEGEVIKIIGATLTINNSLHGRLKVTVAILFHYWTVIGIISWRNKLKLTDKELCY